jgi:hypothetical protein
VVVVLSMILSPVRAIIALAELIQRRVDQESRHPASARRDLEAVEEAHQAGEISAEEQADLQQRVLDRMAAPREETGTSERR